MSMNREAQVRLVQYLYRLSREENRGALAALRRGLSLPPGAAMEMYPYIAPYIPADATQWEEQMCYVVAALFAWHPAASGNERQNLGDAFAEMVMKENQRPHDASPSLQLRLNALLNSHPNDVVVHLRSAISLLRSKGVAVNWTQLLIDLFRWNDQDRYVQRRWAKSFWAANTAGLGDDN